MNLKEKLAKLDRSSPATSIQSPNAHGPAVSAFLPGEEFATESGLCWRYQVRYDLSSMHGQYRIGNLLENNSAPLQFVAKNTGYEDIRLENLLFVDTETTGLSGGVGTVAFLVGIGYFAEDVFVIDQFFMREFSEETAVLQSFLGFLHRTIDENGAVVSFNGKSYDLPLLANRVIFQRLDWPSSDFANIDILHPARRLWKESLVECNLTALESKILGIKREGDVPGYLIPEIYFRYLRSGETRPMAAVFYHNQMDILTLTGLLHEMIKLYDGETDSLSAHHVDWLNMGRAYDDLQAFDNGLQFYEDLLGQNLSKEKRTVVLLRIAAIHKKNRSYGDAVPYWEQALEQDGFCLEAYEELAKVYEHRMVDLAQARKYTERALENLNVLERLRPTSHFGTAREELAWRFSRLQKKITKAAEGGE